jgi:hypothetical protein
MFLWAGVVTVVRDDAGHFQIEGTDKAGSKLV